MTDSTNNSASHPTRRAYTFVVAFLAVFLLALLFWPSKAPVYETRSVIAVDYDFKDADQLANHLKMVAAYVMSSDNLGSLMNEFVSRGALKSPLIKNSQVDTIQSSLKVGLGTSKTKGQLISLALTGSGTTDEQQLVNILGNQFVIELQKEITQRDFLYSANSISLQLDQIKAQKTALKNYRDVLAAAQKQSEQPQLITNEQQEIANPTWVTFNRRLTTLRAEKAQLDAKQIRSSDAESLRVKYETQIVQNILKQTPNRISLNNVAKTESSDPNRSMVRLVSNEQVLATNGTIAKIDGRVSQYEDEQENLIAQLKDKYLDSARASALKVVRVVEPAINSKPIGGSFGQSDLSILLLLSLVVASVFSWQCDSTVMANYFTTPEEVARRLGIPMLGSVSHSSENDENARGFRRGLLRKLIRVGEFAIIGIAFAIFVVAVSQSDLARVLRENPVTGAMEAFRAIRFW